MNIFKVLFKQVKNNNQQKYLVQIIHDLKLLYSSPDSYREDGTFIFDKFHVIINELYNILETTDNIPHDVTIFTNLLDIYLVSIDTKYKSILLVQIYGYMQIIMSSDWFQYSLK